MNVELAKKLIEVLGKNGLREFVICAGARNAPLIEVLRYARGLKVHRFFDERSASFFALGRIKDTNHPVAVITTSGTAVAECLPAVVEAFYSQLPLVIISADRPKSFRGTGAPQTIEQVGLFSHFSNPTIDVENVGDLLLSDIKGKPYHINICFSEPLIDQTVESFRVSIASPSSQSSQPIDTKPIKDFFVRVRKPLVILGALPRDKKKLWLTWLNNLGAPVYAEALSHCREEPALSHQIFQSGEKILSHPTVVEHFDGIVRMGGIPTVRFWRDLEDRFLNLPVLSISDAPFSGLSREQQKPLPLDVLKNEDLYQIRAQWQTAELQKIWDLDQKQTQKLDHLINKHPRAELALLRRLSQLIDVGSRVYLGNSLPIREWDLAASYQPQDFEYQANRGANGIDGQISTFLGWANKVAKNWAFLGDLTALYDLSSLWAVKSLKSILFHLVVINNGGGKIFSPLFKHPDFENRHNLEFSAWAKMFGLSYASVEDTAQLDELLKAPPQIIELRPDLKTSERLSEAWSRSWLKT